MERKLASVRKIDAIDPIPGADAIDVATVGGWKVVVNKGQFSVGQLAVFCEIDSWIPMEVAPFLCRSVKEFGGVKGERLKTIKLRGQLSQGLLLPIKMGLIKTGIWQEGDDVTEALGIQKYEQPLSPQLAGLAKGVFPSFLKKTDQERIQNLTKEFEDWKARGLTFEVTEKLDGSSMTIYFKDGKMGVCSRNLDLIEDENNTFWKVARELLPSPDATIEGAIQGELVGPGIQGNPYKLLKHAMYVFDIATWDDGPWEYATGEDRQESVEATGWKHVPVIDKAKQLPGTIAELLAMADGQSVIGPGPREGLVWKCNEDPSISFKVISNKWLLKHED